MEVTGRLENWEVDPRFCEEDETIIWGYIYDDSRGRWPEGTWIHTSGTANCGFMEGDVIETRNSVYLLGVPANNKVQESTNEVD